VECSGRNDTDAEPCRVKELGDSIVSREHNVQEPHGYMYERRPIWCSIAQK
jgi:hypothetical protein